jgi:glycosyltransferase involved in cell wall biosynthesis
VSPEGLVTAKLLRNLPDCLVDVLTLENGLVSTVLDSDMGRYAEEINGSLYRVSGPKLLQKLCRFTRLPFRPDRWLLLNRVVYRKACKLIHEGHYDCLVTRSQYHSSHLVGLSLKKRYPYLPWIACFSDPWSNADHQASIPFFSSWSKRQEKKVLDAADRLIFPTNGMQAHFTMHKNSLDRKSVVLPHSFDPALYESAPAEKDQVHDSLRLRLFGSFYGTRKPDVLFSAIDELEIAEGQSLSLEIFGPWYKAYESLTHRFPEKSTKRIRYLGQVPHVQALAKMQEADLLVLVDAPGEGKSMYLPSKLVDYIGSGQPILALSREGIVATIVNKLGGMVVDPNSVSAVTDALKQWIACREQPSLMNSALVEEYRSANAGAKFRSMIDELL